MSNVARTPENMNTAKDNRTADAPPRCAPSGGSDASNKSLARIAVERYRDVLANVIRPYAAQMAARPFDPLPLTASEQWLINDARQTAEDAVIHGREHQNNRI
jgi:hypothetical protein